jgi:hypothetical protein
MKEFSDEVQYLIGKSIRRGTVTCSEIAEVAEADGSFTADVVAEKLHQAGVHLVQDRDLDITPQTNVLMNNLTLVELVSLCLQLPVAPKTPRRLHQHVLKRRSYELDLKRLGYLDSDYGWYYLAPAFNSLQRSIRYLFKSGEIPFARDWAEGDRKTDLTYLKALITHPTFTARILPKIRQHYLGLREVKLLISWIQATGELMPTMADIIQTGLKQDGADTVRLLLLSDQPSTAESALQRRRDVCFSCLPQQRCQPLRALADPYQVLMEYRSTTLEALIITRYPELSMADCLLEDRLLVKFFAPYSLVVNTKGFMIDIGLLGASSAILRKNAGRYCPLEDKWFLVR